MVGKGTTQKDEKEEYSVSHHHNRIRLFKMGDESVDGAKLGTKLIMFVAIIMLALAAFLVAKNLVNKGVDNLETTVKSISDSQFTDYDSKVVRGRTVKSAFDTFGNSEYALVVATLSMFNDAKWYEKVNMTSNGKATTIDHLAAVIRIDNCAMEGKSSNTYVNALNYNAQLMPATGGVASVSIGGETVSSLTLDSGKCSFNGDFQTNEAGNVKYYLNQANLSKKGQAEYIADSSSFNANLIKNESGDIMGIVFTQRKLY